MRKFVGRAVIVEFDDFDEVYGEALSGVIVAEAEACPATDGKDAFLIRLDSPFVSEGIRCEYFVATAKRYGGGGQSVFDLASRRGVTCALFRVTPEQAEGPNPCDISWWRGGFASLGCLSWPDS